MEHAQAPCFKVLLRVPGQREVVCHQSCFPVRVQNQSRALELMAGKTNAMPFLARAVGSAGGRGALCLGNQVLKDEWALPSVTSAPRPVIAINSLCDLKSLSSWALVAAFVKLKVTLQWGLSGCRQPRLLVLLLNTVLAFSSEVHIVPTNQGNCTSSNHMASLLLEMNSSGPVSLPSFDICLWVTPLPTLTVSLFLFPSLRSWRDQRQAAFQGARMKSPQWEMGRYKASLLWESPEQPSPEAPTSKPHPTPGPDIQ